MIGIRYLNERGRFELSTKLVQLAMKVYREANIKDEQLLYADMLTSSFFVAAETTQLEKGLKSAEQALDIRERAVTARKLDEYHPNRANSYMNLAVGIANSDPQRAISLHKKALRIREGSQKYKQDQVQGLSLNYLNIGRCQWLVGQLKEAVSSFELCLSIIEPKEQSLGRRFAQ